MKIFNSEAFKNIPKLVWFENKPSGSLVCTENKGKKKIKLSSKVNLNNSIAIFFPKSESRSHDHLFLWRMRWHRSTPRQGKNGFSFVPWRQDMANFCLHIGRLFSLGTFRTLCTEVAQICVQFFPTENVMYWFWHKMVWATFWALFHKSIWSPWWVSSTWT
jgi:hypothetical protein